MESLNSLLTDLEAVLGRVTHARHEQILRQTTDLFLAGAESYGAQETGVFDAVIKRLSRDVGPSGQVELSRRLAAADAALRETVSQLASIEVAAIVLLEKSSALTDEDLVAIAKTKGQQFLLAIASRKTLSEAVTDVLVQRGDTAVKHKVAANDGARFSEFGYACLISAANGDKKLAPLIARRGNIPDELEPFLKVALG